MAAFPVTLEPTTISVPAAGGSINLLLTNTSAEVTAFLSLFYSHLIYLISSGFF